MPITAPLSSNLMATAARHTLTSGIDAAPSHGLTSSVTDSPDIYIPPANRVAEPTPVKKPREVNYDWGYKLKQYGTDALVIGGAALAFALLVSPEPIVTKIIGGIIALLCIVGGTLGKHHFFKEAYLSQALEKAVGRLGAQIDQLDTDIHKLETAREGLEATNQSLEKTRVGFEGEVTNLKSQVDRLKVDVNQAFDELNIDRAAFEKQKEAKLSQLNDEISEADARGNRAQRKLDGIYERESKLNQFEAELETRRKNLVAAETKLESMQAALLRRVTNS